MSTARTFRWRSCMNRTGGTALRISAHYVSCRTIFWTRWEAGQSACCARPLGFSRYRDHWPRGRIRDVCVPYRCRQYHARRLPRPAIFHAGVRGRTKPAERADSIPGAVRRPHYVQRQNLRSAATRDALSDDPPEAAVRAAAHLDLLHGARRLWKLRFANCRLTHLENQVLGVEREGDLPGEMIPYVYFEYLRSTRRNGWFPSFITTPSTY